MKVGDVKNKKVAKKYANALFQTAQNANIVDDIFNELVFVSQTVDTNPQLRDFLINPIIKKEDKKDVTVKLFSPHCNKILIDFLGVLADAGRFNILNEILDTFSDLYNDFRNIIKPVVVSAVELNENQKSKIEEKLNSKFMKKVFPQYVINPDIIGGLIIEAGDKTIDCSIKTKFENMKKQLTKGNIYGNN